MFSKVMKESHFCGGIQRASVSTHACFDKLRKRPDVLPRVSVTTVALERQFLHTWFEAKGTGIC